LIKKKICMLGSAAAGKTSLVRRYVESIFSDRYMATVGVKIDQKNVAVQEQDVTLMLWDIEGINLSQRFQTAYLSGASGYILVADGTRKETFEEAIRVKEYVESVLGDVPFLVAINKVDLSATWEVTTDDTKILSEKGWPIIRTSAKEGVAVEEAFSNLASRMLDI
jgi:small GTP-binding protein